ncbi:protein CFAP20DC isoform X2 [Nothobranchius furzeri]|uniref:protein CFAP20DC isoform X2 n=1 Tax=Nothobranchius furzeri TaxID=105023 RepID=UPI0039046E4E
MFRNSYQGGAVFDIFSGQGKDPVAKWKLSGGPSAIHKEYNKEVKGFVYCLEGSSQTVKMQMPENTKMSLGLIQRFLVLQVNIPRCHDFSIELVITDLEHLKRRLHFSTVHKKLAATPLHARIPLTEMNFDNWCTLCIDLMSLSGELFKGFSTLDAITLFATCKLRRIFTMKKDPGTTSEDGVYLMDMIPNNFRFPPDVIQATHVVGIDHLWRAEIKTDPFSSASAPYQPPTAVSTRDRRAKPQGVLHTASGSIASAPSPQTGRNICTTSDGMERNGFPSSRMNKRMTAESLNITKMGENSSHGQNSQSLHEGASCKFQPRPPQKRVLDKQGCKKLRILGAGRERLPSSAPPNIKSGGQKKADVSREKCTLPSSLQTYKHQPLTPTDESEHQTTDERSCRPAKESSAELHLGPGLSSNLQVWSSWESNEGSEPQLTLQQDLFTFSSPPRSPKRGQSQGDQEKMEMGDDQVQSNRGGRFDARPEDDFIGSESDEEKSHMKSHHPRPSVSCPASPRSPGAAQHVQPEPHSQSFNAIQASLEQLLPNTSMQIPLGGRAKPASMGPTRCLSPNREDLMAMKGSHDLRGSRSVSVCRTCLQEVQLGDSKQHKEEEDEKLKAVDSSHYISRPRGSMQEEDDEEQRMLESLKREQEEDECGAPSLSTSQIHRCDVSISLSCDDASTWTHISVPENQGHHYQKEMNTLLQSNPREWMDVLSPPIMPPSQQRRSGYTQNNLERLVRGEDGLVKEEENEDEYLKLLYDPCLNCYFDPETGKYYELA